MVKLNRKPSTQIRVRPDDRRRIERLRHRMPITAFIGALLDTYESLPNDERRRLIEQSPAKAS